MEITDIRMSLLTNAGGCKAVGSFVLDNSLVVRGMRVMEDKTGRNFVSFPSREKANGEYEDIAFPLSKEFYNTITDAFIKEFNHQMEEIASKVKSRQEEPESQGEGQVPAEETPHKGKAR
jgi:stage V sporulation protein G